MREAPREEVNTTISGKNSNPSNIEKFNNDFPNYGMDNSFEKDEEVSFKDFFGKSVVVDADGKPKIVFHGSLQAFDEFDSSDSWGNNSGQMGSGHYFSDSYKDVNSNYVKGSKDLDDKILKESMVLSKEIKDNPQKFVPIISKIFSISEEGAGEKIIEAIKISESWLYKSKIALDDNSRLVQLAKSILKIKYMPTEGVVYPVYLRIEKPVVFQKNEGTTFSVEDIRRFGISIQKIAEKYGINAKKLLKPLVTSVKKNKLDAYSLYFAFLSNTDWFRIKNSKSGKPMTGQFFSEMCKNAGYDGVIVDAFEAFYGRHSKLILGYIKLTGRKMKGIEGTKHYIVWDSSQIRSAISDESSSHQAFSAS